MFSAIRACGLIGSFSGGLAPGPGEQAVKARPDRGTWWDRVLMAERDAEAAAS